MKAYMRSALASALVLFACKDHGGVQKGGGAAWPSMGSVADFTNTATVAGAGG